MDDNPYTTAWKFKAQKKGQKFFTKETRVDLLWVNISRYPTHRITVLYWKTENILKPQCGTFQVIQYVARLQEQINFPKTVILQQTRDTKCAFYDPLDTDYVFVLALGHKFIFRFMYSVKCYGVWLSTLIQMSHR